MTNNPTGDPELKPVSEWTDKDIDDLADTLSKMNERLKPADTQPPNEGE